MFESVAIPLQGVNNYTQLKTSTRLSKLRYSARRASIGVIFAALAAG